jgi:hypothetical protein
VLADGVYPAGWNTVDWRTTKRSGERLRPGVYFYTLDTGKKTQTRKPVVVK